MDIEDVDIEDGVEVDPLGPLKELNGYVTIAVMALETASSKAGVWDSMESSPGLDRSPEARRVCDAMREADRALETASQAIEDYLAHKERGCAEK